MIGYLPPSAMDPAGRGVTSSFPISGFRRTSHPDFMDAASRLPEVGPVGKSRPRSFSGNDYLIGDTGRLDATSPEAKTNKELRPSVDDCKFCSRGMQKILCRSCGHTFEGRVRGHCMDHPGMIYLMDSETCPKCTSTSMMEFKEVSPRLSSPLKKLMQEKNNNSTARNNNVVEEEEW